MMHQSCGEFILRRGRSRAAIVPALLLVGSVASMTARGQATQSGAQPATSEGALTEIIVTAEKREENLQRTPIMVTAVTADKLDEVNAESLYDIARVAPNVQVGQLVANSIFIRGIGQQQPSIFQDPGVAIYIDGVYRPRINFNSINFNDLDRMEVLNGPQGTLFGMNSVGGAINIVSRNPTDTFGGDAEFQVGSRDRMREDAVLNMPLIDDTLLARVAFEKNMQDGYVADTATGQRLSNTNYYSIKGALEWKVSASIDATLRYDETKQDQLGYGLKLTSAPSWAAQYIVPGFYEESGTAPSYIQGIDDGTSLTLNWRDLGPGSLKVISAYRQYQMHLSADLDGTPLPASQNPDNQYEHFYSEEVDYAMNLLQDKLFWSMGLYYLNEADKDYATAEFAAAPFFYLDFAHNITQDAVSYAGFTQATYAITDKLSATAGVRFTKEIKDTTSFTELVPIPVYDAAMKDGWSATTPKFTLQYQITPDAMAYVTASRGFKAGGFNGAATSLSAYLPYNPEYLWNYEIGTKTEWLDHRLRANLTGYWMNYTGIQENNQTVQGGNLVIEVANAGDARIRGAEAEFDVVPVTDLTFYATASVNDFHYTSIQNVPGVTLEDVLPFSSKYTANAGGQYVVSLGARGSVAIRSDYTWRSRIFFDPENTYAISQGDYGLWSARLTYQPPHGSWSLYAYGLNLANKQYWLGGITTAPAPNGFYDVQQGPPREVGFGVKVQF
jgi:iron complex outermembrane recepter protein